MRQRMTKLVSVLLACALCMGIMLSGAAFAQESAAVIELMPCIGKPDSELAKAVGGFSSAGWPQYISCQKDSMMARVSLAKGNVTGWPGNTTYEIFLMGQGYSLDGICCGDSYADAKARALNGGWTIVSEEDNGYTTACNLAKAIDGVDYTMRLRLEVAGTAVEYITVEAINTPELDNAYAQRAELEAANPYALGGYDNGFIFRNGVTWDSTAEDIKASESDAEGSWYDEGDVKELCYSDPSGVWYIPSLSYYFLMSDTVNYIEYRYYFNNHSDERGEFEYVLDLMNTAYGPSGEPDPEKMDLLVNEVEVLHGVWSLDDGTYVLLTEDSGDLRIMYYAEEFFPLMKEYMVSDPDM